MHSAHIYTLQIFTRSQTHSLTVSLVWVGTEIFDMIYIGHNWNRVICASMDKVYIAF